jgi:hypothetical protein
MPYSETTLKAIPNDQAGVFLLSLDCEGLWGMADSPRTVDSGVINDASLADAYDFILATLTKNGLTATAAFVTAFAVERESLQECIHEIRELARLNPTWFRCIMRALETGSMNGWRGVKLHDSFAMSGMEMAWHGATHLPLSDETSVESVTLELEIACRLFDALDYRPRTIIFPRNEIGHLDLLRKAGFENFRESPGKGIANRVLALVSELNVASKCSHETPLLACREWGAAAAGSFLNWPSGMRRLIPISITTQRWKSILMDAATHGGIAHMWFHPHNLITAPAMRLSFEEIIRFAGQLVKSGDLQNLTIAECLRRSPL